MGKNTLTLEDLLAFETRMKKYIKSRLRELNEMPRPLFYTPAQVAKMVGLSAHAIRHKLRDPEESQLKGVQQSGPNGTWLIPKESVDSWIGSMKRKS